jgi:hypothetical protein
MGTRFAELDELERLTGEPVRWEYRMPGTGSQTPPADRDDRSRARAVSSASIRWALVAVRIVVSTVGMAMT